MKFEELIKDRYSCRKFKNTPVEKEKIEKIRSEEHTSESSHITRSRMPSSA